MLLPCHVWGLNNFHQRIITDRLHFLLFTFLSNSVYQSQFFSNWAIKFIFNGILVSKLIKLFLPIRKNFSNLCPFWPMHSIKFKEFLFLIWNPFIYIELLKGLLRPIVENLAFLWKKRLKENMAIKWSTLVGKILTLIILSFSFLN